MASCPLRSCASVETWKFLVGSTSNAMNSNVDASSSNVLSRCWITFNDTCIQDILYDHGMQTACWLRRKWWRTLTKDTQETPLVSKQTPKLCVFYMPREERVLLCKNCESTFLGTLTWMVPSMRMSFSWLICRAANGAPNCVRSHKYLPTNSAMDPIQYFSY